MTGRETGFLLRFPVSLFVFWGIERRLSLKEIPLNNGSVALVDDADYPELSMQEWYFGTDGYAYTNKRRAMHRIIMNAPRGKMVDHIDHDGLNNQRSNLRLCTNRQNQYHARKHRDNTSGYKGVTKAANGWWVAKIKLDGKVYNLGSRATAREAAELYDKHAKLFQGEFAMLNLA